MDGKNRPDDCCATGDACCAPPPLQLPPRKGAAERADGDACCAAAVDGSIAGYRRVLWAVLAINAAMFAVEIGAGLIAGSASLQADALDFLSDAANYALSLVVVGMDRKSTRL